MIDKDLLAILACPATHQGLALADAAQLERGKRAVRAGSARTVGGTALAEPVEAGLVRQDGKLLYPIRDGIPVLLVEEGIEL